MNRVVLLHEFVGNHLHELSHKALQLIVKVGQQVWVVGNRRISRSDQKWYKEAYAIINRHTIMDDLRWTPTEWESAVQEASETGILTVQRWDTTKNDRYFLLVPPISPGIRNGVRFFTPHSIKARFKKECK